MTDVLSFLRGLTRPRLLIEAAQLGAPHYRRATHLRRLLGQSVLPGPQQAAMRLICLEQEIEAARRAGAAEYSATAHVEIMIALVSEAQAIMERTAQENASATSAFLRVV